MAQVCSGDEKSNSTAEPAPVSVSIAVEIERAGEIWIVTKTKKHIRRDTKPFIFNPPSVYKKPIHHVATRASRPADKEGLFHIYYWSSVKKSSATMWCQAGWKK
jgi:hypothetical protein